jgi:hypothetical protein
MQLDIFNDSRDVMLRNDVLLALQQYDASKAQLAWGALQQEDPDDESLAGLRLLTDAVAALAQPLAKQAFVDHTALHQARLNLLSSITPTALILLAAPNAALWLRPFWQNLITRALRLPFQADAESDHAAPMLLHVQDWQGVLDVVAQIESWRHIPAPLAWMAQAKLQLHGLRATWPLLTELAWLAPKRLDALVQAAPEPILLRLKEQFEASFEPPVGADAAQDLSWLPAWVLTVQPRYAADLALAQPGQHSAPEQAMRLMINLLGLERQGRHHDIVKQRKSLRDLNAWLYGAYLQTR